MSGASCKQDDFGLSEENPASPTTELAILVCSMDDDLLDEFLEEALQYNLYELDGKDSLGMTALHWAVCYKRVHAVKFLVGKGARLNVTDVCGLTPLFYATGRVPCPEIASFLIEKGADVNFQNKNGVTPLHGAALQGNTECVRVLIKHGANAKVMANDGKTPLDVCECEETKKVIYKANKKADKAKEKSDIYCAWCGEDRANLKKCARCHSVMYCGRECQEKHWKEGGHKKDCKGHVFAYPASHHLGGKKAYGLTLSNVLGAKQPTVDLRMHEPNSDDKPKADFLKNMRFVVKVQIPLGGHIGSGDYCGMGDMMVYNEDKSVLVYIKDTEPGYGSIRKKIVSEGFMGIKAYFWAELGNSDTGAVKIYHGKTAPFQQW